MPTLNIKFTQQAIKVGEHKGEEMFVMKVEHSPLLIETHDTSTEAMKKLRNEYSVRIMKEQQK